MLSLTRTKGYNMEWTAYDRHGTKHHITAASGETALAVTIVRLRTAGGVPKVITRSYPLDIGFNTAMTKINTIVCLDEELFDMVVDSQRE